MLSSAKRLICAKTAPGYSVVKRYLRSNVASLNVQKDELQSNSVVSVAVKAYYVGRSGLDIMKIHRHVYGGSSNLQYSPQLPYQSKSITVPVSTLWVRKIWFIAYCLFIGRYTTKSIYKYI